MAAEGKVGLFEYCLRTVLHSYLDVHFGLKKPPAWEGLTLASMLPAIVSAEEPPEPSKQVPQRKSRWPFRRR